MDPRVNKRFILASIRKLPAVSWILMKTRRKILASQPRTHVWRINCLSFFFRRKICEIILPEHRRLLQLHRARGCVEWVVKPNLSIETSSERPKCVHTNLDGGFFPRSARVVMLHLTLKCLRSHSPCVLRSLVHEPVRRRGAGFSGATVCGG